MEDEVKFQLKKMISASLCSCTTGQVGLRKMSPDTNIPKSHVLKRRHCASSNPPSFDTRLPVTSTLLYKLYNNSGLDCRIPIHLLAYE